MVLGNFQPPRPRITPPHFVRKIVMILSGHEIKQQLGENIHIDPFDDKRVNPNSYNLSLHDELLVYEEVVLDMRKSNRVARVQIPEEGLVLTPNQLYLGRTVERTETHNLVPMIEGRSSIGRLGLFVHVTAGFGDVGFCWILDTGNVCCPTGENLSERTYMPNIFSSNHWRNHRVFERQVPTQS